jgi:hypothetical protein
MLLHLLLLGGFSTHSAASSLPDGACSVEGQACQLTEDNFISAVPNVSIEECRDVCYSDPACKFLSHFGPASIPHQNSCQLVNSCATLVNCIDCQTEDANCRTCSGAIEGQLATNVLDNWEVEDEQECKIGCNEHNVKNKEGRNCSHYTYHDSTHLLSPNRCFIQEFLMEPFGHCSNCR